MQVVYDKEYIKKLNEDIQKYFPHLFLIDETMTTTHQGVSRLVMLDRYSQKDINLVSLSVGDIVLVVVKEEPKFPARGIGKVLNIDHHDNFVEVLIEEEFRGSLVNEEEMKTGVVRRKLETVDNHWKSFMNKLRGV